MNVGCGGCPIVVGRVHALTLYRWIRDRGVCKGRVRIVVGGLKAGVGLDKANEGASIHDQQPLAFGRRV